MVNTSCARLFFDLSCLFLGLIFVIHKILQIELRFPRLTFAVSGVALRRVVILRRFRLLFVLLVDKVIEVFLQLSPILLLEGLFLLLVLFGLVLL